MLTYFPSFYEDELLYSAVARYHRHTLSRSWSATREQLYGHKPIRGVVDFPSRLDLLAQNVSHLTDETAEDMAWQRTLLPFYSAFLQVQRQADLVRELRIAPITSGRGLHRMLSHGTQGTPFPSVLRTCTQCVAEDRVNLGETYWRRAHQLQGVHFCTKHELPLMATEYSFRHFNRDGNHCADVDMHMHSYLPALSFSEENILLQLSKLGKQLLTRGFLEEVNIKTSDLYERMANRSKGVGGSIDYSSLSTEFVDFYGLELLELLISENSLKAVDTWLRFFFSPGSRTNIPIRHLLLHHFLEMSDGQPKHVYRLSPGPWACQNPLAPHFGQPTISEYRIPRRAATRCGALFACSCGFEFVGRIDDVDKSGQPVRVRVTKLGEIFEEKVKELMGGGMSTFTIANKLGMSRATIYRNFSRPKTRKRPGADPSQDASAQQVQLRGRPKQQHGMKRRPIVDRTATDIELSQRVLLAARKLAALTPPKRVTAGALARAIGDTAMLVHVYRGVLPKTKRSLEEVVEDAEAFQCRRVRWVFDQWPLDRALTASALRYKSRINPKSAKPAAEALIQELTSVGHRSLDTVTGG